jgi:hypothetical protein
MEAEAHTEQQIIIREVTHIQPSWAERERGEPGAFTLQLVLDYGTEEYILRPTVEDAEAILRLRDRIGRAYFDLQRKVLIFGNIPVQQGGST